MLYLPANPEIEARVQSILDEIDSYGTQKAFARAIGFTETRISRALDPDKASDRRLAPIERAIAKLREGERSGNKDKPLTPTSKAAEIETRPDLVKVAEYGEVGAGPGRVPLEVLSFRIVTRTEFVADFGSEPPETEQGIPKSTALGYFTVAGDSAAPVFFDRERVPVEVLDEPTQFFRNDVIYVFRWEGDLMLKRLRLLGRKKRTENGHEIECIEVEAESLNPSVKPQTYRVTAGDDFVVLAVARVSQKQQLYTTLVGKLFGG